MTPEQYHRLSAAFDDVVSLPPAERRRVLDDRFSDDAELRKGVDDLLAEHDRQDAPVATARGLDALQAEDSGARSGESHAEALLPALKGAYRLLRVIGEGGMGVVYEAEQDFPRRRVALKSIRPGLASRAMLRRFKNEVDLLARLHHTGIAQVFEAGFADEYSPNDAFFVMELVEGLPITRYAKENVPAVEQRLALLLAICDAVQHAHQRGVIHRDLKPGNILVTPAGQPKILDFGIARAVDHGVERGAEDSMHTHPGQVVGTPSYMSPEQLAGETVDTRTDVYSLGVIAYELLAGTLPFDFSKTPIAEATRTLRERKPKPLGSIERRLRGDIEIIVGTAMHPDIARRYSSPAAFADDIRNVLENRPISARADSALHVLGKLARRHSGLVTLAVALLAAILAFAVLSSIMAARNARLAVEATEASKKAEDASARSTALSESLTKELSQARIDRGRAEGAAGLFNFSEDMLWDEYLAAPESPAPRWALWELYHRTPCLWTKPVISASPGALILPKAGRVVIAAGAALHFYDAAIGDLLSSIPNVGAPITCLAAMPDDSGMVLGLANGRLAWVDPVPGANGQVRFLGDGPAHKGAVNCLSISGDGTRIAAGGNDKRITWWDAKAGTLLDAWDAHSGRIMQIAVNEDATRIASNGRALTEDEMKIWRMDGQRTQAEVPLGESSCSSMRFLRRTNVLAIGKITFGPTGQGFNAGTLDTDSMQWTPILSRLSNAIPAVVPSPDGRTFAVMTTFDVILVSPDSGNVPKSLGLHDAPNNACAWMPDGSLLNITAGEMRCYSLRAEPALTRLTGFKSWCFSNAWSPDGAHLAVEGGTSEIVAYDAASLAPTWRHTWPKPGRCRGLWFLKDSRTLVTGAVDGVVRVLDLNDPAYVKELNKPCAEVYSLVVLPDETAVVTGHADGFIRVWNLVSGELMQTLPKRDRRVEGLAVTRDGRTLIAAGGNVGLSLWDTATWSLLDTLPTSALPWGMAISPDEKTLAVTTFSGTIDIFDFEVPSPKLRHSVVAHQRLAPGIAFSPDGNLLATGGEDGTVRLWDAKTFRGLVTFEPHTAEVVQVAFDPTSRYLSFSGGGRTVGVYDLHAMDPFIEGNRAYQETRFKSKHERAK